MPLSFTEIYRVVKLIPKGHVMSYSGVARQCGYPRAARQVGYAMFGLPDALSGKVPWWRVINAQGRISNAYGPEEQRRRLAAEGVEVSDVLRVDMRKYDAEDAVYRKLRARAMPHASPR